MRQPACSLVGREGPMTENFDVVVVGARCAGSPLAALLARQGMRVAVVDRASFPRDMLSTHVVEADGLAFLNRLGLTEHLRATGAPFIDRADLRVEDQRWTAAVPQRRGDVGGIVSVRRHVLDPILVEAAEQAGAQVRFGSEVIGLVREGGRVQGVRIANRRGEETELRAALTVGADGRRSTVAKLCGARSYNVVQNERFAYWAYFEGTDADAKPTFVFHRWEDQLVVAGPTDSGLYQALVIPDLREVSAFRSDLEGSLMRYLEGCEPVAAMLDGAQRAGKIRGALRWTGFFREPSGPGWALAGDAGLHKDPTPGRGISDAFRQVDTLAPAVLAGLGGSDDLDKELKRWGRKRDREFVDHYWLAMDLGKAGRLPTPAIELIRRMHARGKMSHIMDLLSHRRQPRQVLTRRRGLEASARLLARPGCDRRTLLQECRALAAEDLRRAWRKHQHAYAPVDPAADRPPLDDEARAERGSAPAPGTKHWQPSP